MRELVRTRQREVSANLLIAEAKMSIVDLDVRKIRRGVGDLFDALAARKRCLR